MDPLKQMYCSIVKSRYVEEDSGRVLNNGGERSLRFREKGTIFLRPVDRKETQNIKHSEGTDASIIYTYEKEDNYTDVFK